MNDQAIRFRFGIFVLASIILLAVLTILFGGFPSYFKRTDTYKIVFTNAQGVAPGTPVRRSGVRIGEVRTVALDNATGEVQVEIRIDDKYSLRKGDRPTLQQGLLGGDATIAFLPPEDKKLDDPTPVEPGAVIKGVVPADAGALMQKTADLVQPAQEAVGEVKKVMESINKLTPLVKETLEEFREVGKMAKQVAPEVQKTAEEIRLLSKTTRETIPELKRTNEEIQVTVRTWGRVGERTDVLLKTNEEKIVRSIERMEEALKRVNVLLSDENQKLVQDTLKNFNSSSKQIDSTLKKADGAIDEFQKAMKPLGEKGPTILKNVDEAADNLNRTLKDVRELMQAVARGDGTIQRLVTDPALYNNLNDSAAMVTKILPRLDRVLQDMEIFSDRLARHPELLGLRGAIVPSVGLKESPSVIPYRVIP
jgi:phospholipid/cholesterol/gamma-HCH transport system substrate-binding protein